MNGALEMNWSINKSQTTIVYAIVLVVRPISVIKGIKYKTI